VFGISMWEIVLILVVALIVLGPKQLVETARAAGKVYREILKMAGDIRGSIDLDSLSSHEPRITPAYRPPTPPSPSGQDTIPPAGAKSGPDFYADLLESSKEEPQEEKPEAEPPDKQTAANDATEVPKTPSTGKQ
jgi:Sec-independent protein translocase protein TatA